MIDPILVAAHEAQRHDLAPVWASFYPAAHAFAVGLVEQYQFTGPPKYLWPILHVDNVCDCIAALSPQVAWDYNMTLATRAVQLWASGTDWELRGLSGQTKANVKNAASALNGTGPGKGPKVNAFAKNIRGDWSVVCVDHHMLEAAGRDPKRPSPATRRDVARRVTLAATRYAVEPATMQALIWGWWRAQKGYQTYGWSNA